MQLPRTILGWSLCALVAGCGNSASTQPAATTRQADAVPRIVSTVPAATLNLILIGAADRLVGVSTFDRDFLPADKKDLPVVGDYQTMNYEQLVGLHPTALVIQTIPARIPPRLKEVTDEHHIELLNMKFDHVSDIWDSVRVLARAAGREAAAEKAIAAAQADLKDLEEQYKDLPHPKVAFIVGSNMLAGGATFMDEIITAAGGANAGTLAGNGFIDINNDMLMSMAPEVLLISAPGEIPAMKDDPRLAPFMKLPIPAATSGRIYLVTDPSALDASVDIGKNVRTLAALIHQASPRGISLPPILPTPSGISIPPMGAAQSAIGVPPMLPAKSGISIPPTSHPSTPASHAGGNP